ncbi:MAG: choice-of-anchor D domain-containing protein [Candidatus Sulfotelmatobacter sp.]
MLHRNAFLTSNADLPAPPRMYFRNLLESCPEAQTQDVHQKLDSAEACALKLSGTPTMRRRFLIPRAAKDCAGVGLLLLGLATMVGCQGFSSSKAVSGTGVAQGALAANPTSLSFGTVEVGNNQQLTETVTNTGGSAVTISQVGISGAGFTLGGISAPVTLAAGQSLALSVTFTPQGASAASGSVTITSNGSNPSVIITASGTGTTAKALLTATPATLGIGSVFVGSTETSSGSLNASGANVTITAATTNNSRFTISGLSLPAVIPAGQSAPFTVSFSPQVTGADSATLTFTSDAQPSTTTEATTGTGTAAPTHTVNLSWSASTSPNISGYNIYRAVYMTSCGSYSKINGSTLDTVTTYSDPSVTDGTNYCYATTAVNSTNEESGYSNIVSDVQIPAP